MKDRNRWGALSDNTSRAFRLFQRHRILAAIRQDLNEQGFLEIETPLVVKTTCPDANIESISTDEGYLVTSTEYQIKRLIVGGFEKIFTLGKNFRAGDRGRYHSSEFTMIEWARAHDSLKAIEQDAERFIKHAFSIIHKDKISLNFNGSTITFLGDWEHLTVKEAFKQYLNMDDLEDFSLKPLLRSAAMAKVSIPLSFQENKNLVISYLLDELQSHLGKTTPTFLHSWPAYLTASAPLSKTDPYATERTELYIGGIEISNGFPFLTDVKNQQLLFNEELNLREQQGKASIQIDEKYLEALKELPAGAGMALGIDRLVMVLTNASSINDVQAFSWNEL